MKFPSIYLASGSPRRSELLSQIGVNFTKLVSEVDESVHANEQPEVYVQRVATAKAKAVWQGLAEGECKPVLAADTAVVIGDTILGKPSSLEQAREMLVLLAGNTHRVMTSVVVIYQMHVLHKLNISEVTFNAMSPEDIDWYAATSEGLDKAGAYAVQGLAAIFIKQIYGSYSGIMGLPLDDTAELLKQIGMLLDE